MNFNFGFMHKYIGNTFPMLSLEQYNKKSCFANVVYDFMHSHDVMLIIYYSKPIATM